MAIKNEVNIFGIFATGVISAMLIAITMFGLQGWFVYLERQEIAEKWDKSINTQLDAIRAEQMVHLTTVRTTERDKKNYQTVAIESAKKSVAEAGGKLPQAPR